MDDENVLKTMPPAPVKKHRRGAWSMVIVVSFMFLFLFIGWFNYYPESFGLTGNEETSKTVNAVYFWTTTTSTVGYGDILPQTSAAKLAVGVYQCFLTVLAIGGLWYITDNKISNARSKLASKLH